MRSWLHMWQIKGKKQKPNPRSERWLCASLGPPVTFPSWWKSSSGWQCLHLDTRAHSGLRVKIKLLIGCGFHNQHISSQMNAYGRFWTSVLDRALNSLTIKLPESMPRCIKAVGFSFNLPLIHLWDQELKSHSWILLRKETKLIIFYFVLIQKLFSHSWAAV